jgi:glutathione S-transferase
MPKPHRLLVAAASPFARKCAVAIRERALSGIEEVAVNAMESPEILVRANPIGQIPALILDDGSSISNSPLICAFLDTFGDAPPLSPPDDWAARRREAAADGLMELSVKLRFEQLRPEGERSPSWQARWRANIARALDVAEADAGQGDRLDIGAIAWGCALGYLDLRHPDIAWREGRPMLASLYERLSARPSFIETRP